MDNSRLPINDRPIGVFDSGIGGLTVAAALRKHLPGEDIIYLGDTARVPYGTKSTPSIKRYALESSLFLLNRGVKMIVVACNTVSAVALPHLKELLRVPLIGVLDPGVEAGLKATRSGRIGVIGTPSTIASGAYPFRMKQLTPDIQVWSKACPLFVPLTEEGRTTGHLARKIAKTYLNPLLNRNIDTLILGCTHYPLLKDVISDVMGNNVKLVDSAETTAHVVKDVLLREGLLRTFGKSTLKCYVTDVPRSFNSLTRRFFGMPVGRVMRVDIEE